ncbi:patatin-like phospholipase family protein [Luteirhabdus pelagi]|uniref:patatin-like phospholipase family protein n=1 Tax=Luteirhabdus pelagi TaxID=2792783 RepID=UPI00193A970B|nr:patatin-like phospholipase family protein [Luteirhabdus pelagi]
MGRSLRICLAMGGGVSLGSFSGSALTEALKLLVLYGKYKSEDESELLYDKIIVDGMSGASAGAISLTILLKCLIDYTSMLPLLEKTPSEDELIAELANDYFSGNISSAKNHERIETLKALQVAQLIQYQIWVEEVDSKKLYGDKGKDDFRANIHDSFGLLDRGLLERLTKKYLMKSDGIDISNRKVLDKTRVVFACSLTNLLPIEIEMDHEGLSKLEKNVLKSVGSQNHSEIRVIDFVFDESKLGNKDTDNRWLKFTNQPDQDKETHFSLTGKESWATISASALACGAFPIAFEPVLLKRYDSEYGKGSPFNQWPTPFLDLQNSITNSKNRYGNDYNDNSFFAEKNGEPIDYKSFNFPYIDGGTFNNEPIKEAFRIGAFQDFGNFGEEQDRLILFVDPIVREDTNHSFKVDSFTPIKSDKELAKPNSEINKLIGATSGIIGLLANQGSIKEEHKILDTKENFELRNTVFKYLEKNPKLGDTMTVPILKSAFAKIYNNLWAKVISSGTRNPISYFLNELAKNCHEKGIEQSACLAISPTDLEDVKEKIDKSEIGDDDMAEVYKILGIATDDEAKNTFAQTVFKLIIDFSLNTDGKNPNATRAAILPINKELNTINLPGSELEAFGGFASLAARQYAFEYGRLSALKSLSEEDGFRKGSFLLDDNLNHIEQRIENKIRSIGFYDKENDYSGNLKNNLFVPSVNRIKGMLLKNKLVSFLLLKVPFVATSLLGTLAMPVVSIVSLWKSIFSKSPWRGSNILQRVIDSGSSQVNYVTLTPINFSILSDKKIGKKVLVRCSDCNDPIKITAHENDFKSEGQKRYQYLFQLYLLKYVEKAKMAQVDSKALSSGGVENKLIERMGISMEKRVKLPKDIDGNFDVKGKQLALQKNYTKIVEEIRIDRVNLPFIVNVLNDDSQTLHHSVKNINAHVNPLVEIDVNRLGEGWYFREQTESLDLKMLK